MPRDGSGNYTLVAGNPVVTGTLIESVWANTTLEDVASEMTASLDRSGKGGMLSRLKLIDGSRLAPSISFNSDALTGLYLAGISDYRITVNQKDFLRAAEVSGVGRVETFKPLFFVNESDVVKNSNINAGATANDQRLELNGGKDNTDGAVMTIYGDGDTTNAGKMVFKAGSPTALEVLTLTDINVEVFSLLFVNPEDKAQSSIIYNLPFGARQVLRIFGGANAGLDGGDGGGSIELHGINDVSEPSYCKLNSDELIIAGRGTDSQSVRRVGVQQSIVAQNGEVLIFQNTVTTANKYRVAAFASSNRHMLSIAEGTDSGVFNGAFIQMFGALDQFQPNSMVIGVGNTASITIDGGESQKVRRGGVDRLIKNEAYSSSTAKPYDLAGGSTNFPAEAFHNGSVYLTLDNTAVLQFNEASNTVFPNGSVIHLELATSGGGTGSNFFHAGPNVILYRHVNGVRSTYNAGQQFSVQGFGAIAMYKFSDKQYMFECSNVISS